MAKPWKQVVANPEYQALSEQDKARAKVQYFNDVVRPQLAEEDLPEARSQFFSYANDLDANPPVSAGDVGRAALALGSGAVSWIPEGLAKFAGVVSGQAKEGAELGEAIKAAMTPDLTPGAQRIVKPVSDAFEWYSDKTRQAADAVYENTPFLPEPLRAGVATGVRVAGEAVPFVAPPAALKGVRKVRGDLRSLDQLRDLLTEAKQPTVPVTRNPMPTPAASSPFSPELATQVQELTKTTELPAGQGFTMPEGTPFLPQTTNTIRLPYEPIGETWVKASPNEFVAARDKSTRPEFLTQYTPEDLSGMETRKLPGLDVGYAIKPDGDIVNVFDNAAKGKDYGASAIIDAIRNGGFKLDCYDGPLVDFYENLGFKRTGKIDPFVLDSAHPDWVKKYGVDYKPDIVYMEYGGAKNDPTHAIRSYEAAQGRRLEADPERGAVSNAEHYKDGAGTRGRLDNAQPKGSAGPVQGSVQPSLTAESSPTFYGGIPGAQQVAQAIKGVGNYIKESLDRTVAPRLGALPGETFAQRMQRGLQDSMLGLKEWERKYFPGISKEKSAYYAEERMHGAITDDLARVTREIYEPFTKESAKILRDLGSTLDEFDLYLKAKYAPTRNKLIQERNLLEKVKAAGAGDMDRLTMLDQLGSGMDDATAATIIKTVAKEGKTAGFERLADFIYKAQQKKLNIIEKYGLETPEVIAQMKAEHGPFYVPLKGKEGIPSLPGKGSSLDVRSSGLQGAIGRITPSENAVVHTFNDLEATIRRARQNEVGNAFLKLAEEYRDPGIEVNAVKMERRYNPETGQVEVKKAGVWTPDVPPGDNIFATIRDGQHYYIRINDNPMLLSALKSEQVPPSPILHAIGGATRTIAGLVTRWSPEFTVTNPIRDAFDALQGVATEHKAGMAAQAVKSIPGAARAMFRYFMDGKAGEGWDPYVQEFSRNGGQVGFYSGKDYAARLKNLERQIRLEGDPGVKGMAARSVKGVFDLISDFTGAGENGTRLAVYRTMRENGFSIADAVSYAKNITINFNRHGDWRAISQLYMFANPGIQSIKRYGELLRTPKGKAIMGGLTATALALTEANRILGGEDEFGNNNYEKLPQFERDRNLIIMNPATGKPGVKIPLGFYSRLPFSIANSISSIYHEEYGPAKAGMNIVDAALDAFNPIGGANLTTSLVPTIAKPFAEVALNQDFTGRPIRPDQNIYAAPKPDSQLFFDTVSPISKAITERVNRATGGNEFVPGSVDVSPETVDHVVKFLTGGPGKTIYRTASLAAKFFDTDKDPFSKANVKRMYEDTIAQEVPILGRFTGSNTEYWHRGQFKARSAEALQKYAEIKGMAAKGDDLERYSDRDFAMAVLGERTQQYREYLSETRKAIETIRNDPDMSEDEKRDQINEIRDIQREIMQRFIAAHKEAKRIPKASRPSTTEMY